MSLLACTAKGVVLPLFGYSTMSGVGRSSCWGLGSNLGVGKPAFSLLIVLSVIWWG